MTAAIQPHNQRPATVWGSGGAAYEEISRQIASALAHCVRRANPKAGERILDLATGTGWTSRLLAERGAMVTGVDIAAELLAAARMKAPPDLALDYQVGDAEALRFADASFDAVTSTFGVMFASRPEDAAGEIARVCRKGGRIALTTWKPDSTVSEMFQVMRPYMPPPPNPAPPSPFAWGSRERMTELFGRNFDLAFEEGETICYERNGEAVWDVFVNGYGPTKMLAESLEPARREAMKRDFIALHDAFKSPLGIAMPRQYLLTVGVRR
ncbi:MAG TPA: class I SAM-dependent methyltransferase [Bauldia sp.]|nr:class I SAM-dependent methyltransferase [Bauldia sp.]